MEKKILNIGCGFKHIPGAINIDSSTIAKPNLILDLEKDILPFEDNSVDEIHAYHILEHIKNIISLMNECYRVLKTDGKMFIEVPQNEGTWADPTHTRAFSKLSFRYYCDYPVSNIYGITSHFKQEKCQFRDNEDGGQLDVVLIK